MAKDPHKFKSIKAVWHDLKIEKEREKHYPTQARKQIMTTKQLIINLIIVQMII